MYYYEVAPSQIIRAGSQAFTYTSDTPLALGTIVIIEVGKKQLVGVVINKVSRPTYVTKPVVSVVEETPLPPQLVDLALWLSDYYVTHLATVLQTILARGLTKKRRLSSSKISKKSIRDRTKIVLNKDQQLAVQAIESMDPGTALLHGITGSGKTAVYVALTKQTLAAGKSVVILVPEIALTSQVVDEFSQHFSDILLTHSRQTEAIRHKVWREALTSDNPRVIIGPRSALFLPLKNIGLIVIDEAHEPSFKQEQSPRYSALRAASILASKHQARLIFGTATPPVADYFIAEQTHRPIVTMGQPARPARKPSIKLVDMTKRQNFKKHRFLSDSLLDTLMKTFERGQQALLFHNRRGSASTTLCENCGWQADCPRCFVPLTLHGDAHTLRCHICGLTDRVPTSCLTCHHTDIVHKGIGTKLIESELRKFFPDKTIMRFDGDSEQTETLEQKYSELYNGSIDLIIGTQVIAKGLDLPKLRTVGVVQADAGLSLPDYTSTERTFQLLAQVIGRVGRSDHDTDVIIQSYQPAHQAVVFGLNQDYTGFYDMALEERRRALFPPFTYLLKLTCLFKTEATAIKNSQALKALLEKHLPSDVEILGPTPAFYERQRDTYRWQLVLKSPSRALLVDALAHVPPTHWQFELDPISLL